MIQTQKMMLRSFVLLSVALLSICGFLACAFSQTTSTNSSSNVIVDSGGRSTVGGVSIDANGLISTTPMNVRHQLAQEMQKRLQDVPNELAKDAPLRRVSLKKLDQFLKECTQKGQPIPDDVKYMGGLLAIRYIVAVPEENDVLLVGPAEGWRADAVGNVIGRKTGQPVLHLEDFVTVLRAWSSGQPSAIVCSIDPTQEALVKIDQLSRSGMKNNVSPVEYARAMEAAYGENTVSVGGIPGSSRMANILVAADYRMKRLGLGQEQAPIRNFPSYVSLVSPGRSVKTSRFWLTPENTAITHDEEKLTYEIASVSVKTLSENEFFDRSTGARTRSGGRDIPAERWSEMMTKRYDELSLTEPVFADLKNCMEIAVAVALIKKENLLERTKCQLTTLADASAMPLPAYSVPKFVQSKATTIQRGTGIVLACGGVEINPSESLNKVKTDAKLSQIRTKVAVVPANNWYGN